MQSVLASEQKVLKMMEHIDNAISEADKFENRLDSYEDILGHVKETMEKIGGKNAMIEIANNNNIKLMKELNKVIVRILSVLNFIVFNNSATSAESTGSAAQPAAGSGWTRFKDRQWTQSSHCSCSVPATGNEQRYRSCSAAFGGGAGPTQALWKVETKILCHGQSVYEQPLHPPGQWNRRHAGD